MLSIGVFLFIITIGVESTSIVWALYNTYIIGKLLTYTVLFLNFEYIIVNIEIVLIVYLYRNNNRNLNNNVTGQRTQS